MVPACDFRDLPAKLTYAAYNREEFQGEAPAGTLVVGAQIPSARAETYLHKVANVIGFEVANVIGSGGNGVLGQTDANVNVNLRQPFGWFEAQLESQANPKVCQWDQTQDSTSPSAAAVELSLDCATSATGNAPVIGFAAWSRGRLAANPNASYGRIVEHSYGGGGGDSAVAADAGPDMTVDEESTVSLSGTGLTVNTSVVSQSWAQAAGQTPQVTIANPNAAVTSFKAPKLPPKTASVSLQFTFTVRDAQNRTGSDSVAVTVRDINNNAPVMTSADQVDLETGIRRVLALTADDDDTTGEIIGFTLGGRDAALFRVEVDAQGNAVLYLISTSQGDALVCFGLENPCVITVTPSDGKNTGNPQTVTIMSWVSPN